MRRGAIPALAAATFLLFAVGPFLRTPDFDAAFAFDVPLPATAAAAGAVLALLALLARRPEAAARAAARLPLPLLAGAAVAAFFALPARSLSGDATAVLLRAAAGDIYPSNALTDFATAGLIAGSGLDPARAVGLVSTLSGAAFAAFALLLARECRTDPAGRAGVAILLLTCGTSLLFFGRLEVYAPPAAAMTGYLALALRRVNGRGGNVAAPLALGIAFSLHGSAGLLLPTLLFLEKEAKVRLGRSVARGLLFLLPVAATFLALYLLAWRGVLPPPGPDRTGTFLGAMGQGPLLPVVATFGNLLDRYAILDLEHLLGVANVLALSAPVAAPLLLLCRRDVLRDPRVRFAAVAAAPFVAFPLLWNVSYPLRYDWDLFVAAGVPLTLLGALACFPAGAPAHRILAAGALSLCCLVPRVAEERAPDPEARDTSAVVAAVLRALPGEAAERWRPAAEDWQRQAEALDTSGTQALFVSANEAANDGRPADAVPRYEEVLAREPAHPLAALNLGRALEALGRPTDARRAYGRAMANAPLNLDPRLRLAAFAAEEGRLDEAIRILEAGIRAGSTHARVPEALTFLAGLCDARGRPDRAAAARRLLAERRRAMGL